MRGGYHLWSFSGTLQKLCHFLHLADTFAHFGPDFEHYSLLTHILSCWLKTFSLFCACPWVQHMEIPWKFFWIHVKECKLVTLISRLLFHREWSRWQSFYIYMQFMFEWMGLSHIFSLVPHCQVVAPFFNAISVYFCTISGWCSSSS